MYARDPTWIEVFRKSPAGNAPGSGCVVWSVKRIVLSCDTEIDLNGFRLVVSPALKRCRIVWRQGLLVGVDPVPDRAPCLLEPGHDGGHKFKRESGTVWEPGR